MPFAISKSVSLPKKMVPRTLNKPKEVEKPEKDDEEQTTTGSTQQKPKKKVGLSITTTNLDTEDNL
jgi:hypothetical protein